MLCSADIYLLTSTRYFTTEWARVLSSSALHYYDKGVKRLVNSLKIDIGAICQAKPAGSRQLQIFYI